MGNVNSRTILHVVRHDDGEYMVAAKELAMTKSVKWAALSVWTSPVKHFKVGPMFRLGTEYKALRFLRQLGLDAPKIEAVIFDERRLVTSFINGRTMADVIRGCIAGKEGPELIRTAGAKMAEVHNAGASFGNIKPKNVIVDKQRLYFTDLEQFLFSPVDQAWDIAQFVCWDLKGTRDAAMAGAITREFLDGYSKAAKEPAAVAKLSKSRRYIESFFPVLAPAVAKAVKAEVRKSAA
jgi:tRNA A-37 threonylcarbamoyl transferase component Bud32